eukprot:9491616-Pyramimonas_sp.AAC.2
MPSHTRNGAPITVPWSKVPMNNAYWECVALLILSRNKSGEAAIVQGALVAIERLALDDFLELCCCPLCS